MMSKNKLLILIILCVFLVSAFVLLSCNDTRLDTGSQQLSRPLASSALHREQVNNPYSWVGEEHNQGLAIMFEELSAAGFDLENVRSVVNTIFNNYLESIDFKLEGVDLAEYCWDLAEHDQILRKSNGRYGSALDSIIATGDFSNLQQLYLTKISNLAEENLPLGELWLALDEIDRVVVNEFDEEEGIVILIASAVTRSSSEYWLINMDYWIAMFKDNLGEPGDITVDLHPVIVADATGAVIGAILGAATTAGAAPVAVATALGSSLVKSVDIIVDAYL